MVELNGDGQGSDNGSNLLDKISEHLTEDQELAISYGISLKILAHPNDAIGKKFGSEHSGCMRGLGGNVCPSKAFGMSKNSHLDLGSLSSISRLRVEDLEKQMSLGETNVVDDSGDVEEGATQNPWQIGVHHHPSEDGEPWEVEAPIPIRRSTRVPKPNPKYANATILEEVDSKEPETFEEASQKPERTKTMKEENSTLEQNQTWDLVLKSREVKPISYKWI
ncbi:hypothetical protein CQW23_21655 [Capsicum baccatum]|uniref:Uncharacterized protein n=1 Tax=Capsicum baccatum TaxID=33114 RepID=A0A2G2VYM9_CAPBA|nr:hypothetical protein CQW23_21655 [Capsicum baccatum]